MEKVTVIMNNGRAKSMDVRFARTLVKLKKAVYADIYEKKVIDPVSYVKKDLSELRAKYQDKFGKKAYHGWSEEELQSKLESHD